jgi:ribosomal protein L29
MTEWPLRHCSDDNIERLIKELRAEQKRRRQTRAHFDIEVNQHRIGRGYGKGYQLSVMRRTARWP